MQIVIRYLCEKYLCRCDTAYFCYKFNIQPAASRILFFPPQCDTAILITGLCVHFWGHLLAGILEHEIREGILHLQSSTTEVGQQGHWCVIGAAIFGWQGHTDYIKHKLLMLKSYMSMFHLLTYQNIYY